MELRGFGSLTSAFELESPFDSQQVNIRQDPRNRMTSEHFTDQAGQAIGVIRSSAKRYFGNAISGDRSGAPDV